MREGVDAELLARVVARTPTALRICTETETLYVNDAWRALWGEPPRHGHPEGRIAEEAVRRALQGEVFVSPVRIRAPGARDRWLRTVAFALDHTVVLLHQDVSDLVHTKRALRTSRERWRRLLAIVPDIVVIHRNGRLAYLNPAAVRAFRAKSAAELLGKPAIELVHPDDRSWVAERIRRGIEEGKAQPLAVERLIRLDGEVLWAEVSAAPLPDEPRTVIVVARDITERVQAEEQSRLLRTAIEQSAEPVMILDQDARVIFANDAACRLHARPRQEILGRSAAELRGGQPGDALFSEIIGAIRAGKPWQGEIVLATPEGNRLVARRVTPVRDEQGRIRWQIVIDRDITEERRRRERIEHLQRLESLGVLAGGIAHDFNNLLAAILGQAALGEREAPIGSPLRERLSLIAEAAERGAELCRQMLAYAGKGQHRRELIDLNDLVREIERLLTVSVPKRTVLRLELAENLPPIEADPAQLRQVLMNLVINAAEAIGERSGAITIATGLMQVDEEYLQTAFVPEPDARPGRFVYLEVSDTGCGMDEETMRRIFEPFFTTKFTGRGLGMSAVLGIVRAHKGAIKVYSELGKGTTFKVFFPVADAEQAARKRKAERDEIRGEGLVLVVDDEEAVREVAAMILEAHGWQTITAADGVEAVKLVRRHRNALVGVLLDMTMPKMDGAATLSEIRRIVPELAVILTSGYNESAAMQRFAGKRLSGFLQKPYRPEELVRLAAEVFVAKERR